MDQGSSRRESGAESTERCRVSVTKKELKTGRLPETVTREDIMELARTGKLRRFLENSFGVENQAFVDRILAADGSTRPAISASKFGTNVVHDPKAVRKN
jgi:hypothetical protein